MGTSRGKIDKLDAIQIVQYAYKHREIPRSWTPKRDIIQELDRLTAIRPLGGPIRIVNAVKMLETPLE